MGYLLFSVLKVFQVCATTLFCSLCSIYHRIQKSASWFIFPLWNICWRNVDNINIRIHVDYDWFLLLWNKLLFISPCAALLHHDLPYCKARWIIKHWSTKLTGRKFEISTAWVPYCLLPHPLFNNYCCFAFSEVSLAAWRLLPNYKKVLNSKTTDPAYVIFHESKGWSHNLLASEKDWENRNTKAAATFRVG